MEKYFTPDIEDIRVGYECEIAPTGRDPFKDDGWTKHIITANEGFRSYVVNGYVSRGFGTPSIRVPYLTKEQIEAEGWKADEHYPNEVFDKGRWRVSIVYLDRHEMWISEIDKTYGNPNRIYAGECKDINTFRYICKLLKIN